ncbi:MAG: FHA domain-containing protein [Planctomycetota bacterium]|nr:FHA domain-containing protein [Planctomycetota bacterium]
MFASDRPSGNDPLIGPVDLEWARNVLRGMSSQSFLKRYKNPALILSHRQGVKTMDESTNLNLTRRATLRGPTIQAGVTLLAQRNRGVTEVSRVSMGRSNRADICVKIATISKAHIYFEKIENDWTVLDNESTNGTFLGDQRLDPNDRHILASGDMIYLGPDLGAIFLMPNDLMHYVLG